MEAPLSALKEELKEVKDDLKNIKAVIATGGFSEERGNLLLHNQGLLLSRLDKLENDIKSLTPTTAPPGNTITLPNSFPILHSLFSFSLSPLFVTPSPLFHYITFYKMFAEWFDKDWGSLL